MEGERGGALDLEAETIMEDDLSMSLESEDGQPCV